LSTNNFLLFSGCPSELQFDTSTDISNSSEKLTILNKKKYKQLSLDQQLQLIKGKENKVKNNALGKEYDIAPKTVQRILNRKAGVIESVGRMKMFLSRRKRKQLHSFKVLDDAVLIW
jgi:hypothetical protein